MAAAGEITPMPEAAIFADTHAEPASVYRWLDWLEKKLPFPVLRVSHGNLETDTLVMRPRKGGRGFYIISGIPHYSINADGSNGHGPRQCTYDYKITPILKAVRSIVKDQINPWRKRHATACKALSKWKAECKAAKKSEKPQPMRPDQPWRELQSDPLVIQWIGISMDEVRRIKESRLDYIANRWPLVDLGINRSSCLKWMSERGFPKPPRSACVFCPYHSDNEWLRLKTEEPEDFQRAVRFERAYHDAKVKTVSSKGFRPFLHNARVFLDNIDFRNEEQRGQLNLFNNECEGMCGV
jgi:hypothetical protein